ncbi:MAG: hypothetical protein ACI4TU_02220 [Candidatus Cryptobacteroides sp.]
MNINLDKIKFDIGIALVPKPMLEQSGASVTIRIADELFLDNLISICAKVSDRPQYATIDLVEGEIRILKKNIKSKYLLKL